MKLMLSIVTLCFILLHTTIPSYSAVTTTDGLVTLDFYEDTQSGIDNRWVLDFTMNDISPDILGGWFELRFWDNAISFENEYNESSPYFYVSKFFPTADFEDYVQDISSFGKPMIPVGTNFPIYGLPNELFYQTEGVELRPIIGTIDIVLNGENMQLTGPVGFAPVPEPISILLFAFGAFFLKRILIKW